MSNPNPPFAPTTEPIPGDDKFVPALVVIDMQNDFVSGSLAVPEGAAIIPKVNELINLPGFKYRVATRDFHPADHVSFAATHGKPPLSTKVIFHPDDKDKLFGMQQVLWPVHCVAYTGGADPVPGLITDKFDHVLYKGAHPHIESYSAFRDIWGKNPTELAELLEQNGITDVFYVGLAGDYCVKYTAKDSAECGFRTWVVIDAVKSISQDSVAWDEMKEKGVKFTTLEDVVKRLGADKL